MIGEPVASAKDLHGTRDCCCWRSSVSCRLSKLMPKPGCQPQVVWRAILLIKPILMRRRNSRSTYTKQTVVSYEQSKRHSIGLDKAHSECARYASSLSLRLVWKRCPGRGSAANAKNASTPRLDTGNIGLNHQRESAIAPGLFA